jgi:ribosomal-protein-alanine N-acetyltransferase
VERGRQETMDGLAENLRFDLCRAEDLDRLLAIEETSFTAPWSRKMLEAELSGNPFSSLVAARRKDGDREDLVGYICFWVVFEELRLMNLAVDPLARRQGVAKALVRYALSQAREQGAERALLEVRASNDAALRLYAGFGFRQVAVRTGYYTNPCEDAVLMERASLTGEDDARRAMLSQTGGG